MNLTYRGAGVDIDSADRLVAHIKALAKKTARPEVIAGIGGFGALFEIGKRYRDPVLDRKSTRLNSSHESTSRMPSSA